MPNRVHPLLDSMQPPGRHPPVDEVGIESQFGELLDPHHPVLLGRKFSENPIRRPNSPPTGRFPSI
jgi:hypothetical protein